MKEALLSLNKYIPNILRREQCCLEVNPKYHREKSPKVLKHRVNIARRGAL
jgi:hypothetical protein